MIRKLKCKESRIKLISWVLFGGVSDGEANLLEQLLNLSINNSLTLTVELSKQIRKDLGITESSYSTNLFRLEKKELIKRIGKTVYISPAFSGLDALEGVLISF